MDTTDIRDYHIHHEMIEISSNLFTKIADLKSDNKKILAVGPTVCRTIESLPYLWKVLQTKGELNISEKTKIYWDALCEDIPEEDYII